MTNNKIFPKIVAFLFVLIAFSHNLSSKANSSSYEGTHFYLAFMQNENGIMPEGIYLQIFICSSEKAYIEVRVPGEGNNFYSLEANEVLKVEFPPSIESRTSEIVQRKGIEVLSDVPITIYAFSSQYTTSDSYTAIPIARWGKEYVVSSFPNDQYSLPLFPMSPQDSASRLDPRQSEFLIMAAYDDSQITITPKAITELGKQINKTYEITLNKGESYLVKALKSQRGTGDLTGTIIRSDKPIGVLSGHVRTANPQTPAYPYDSKDHLVEMLFPTEAWGKKFFTAPFGINKTGDLFKLTNIYPNTVVTVFTPTKSQTYELSEPGSFAVIAPMNEIGFWTSNYPVQLAQMIMRTGTQEDDDNYDPAMVMIPPAEQFVQKIVFLTPGNNPGNPNQYVKHYASIIADKSALETLLIDDTPVSSIGQIQPYTNIDNNVYSIRVELKQAKHTIECNEGGFCGLLYGVGRADSYAMVLGSSLSNPYIKDTIPPFLTFEEYCGELAIKIRESEDSLNTGIAYLLVLKDSTYNYSWEHTKITDTTTYIEFYATPSDYTQEAKIVFDYRDKNGNGSRFSFVYPGNNIEVPENIYVKNVKDDDSVVIYIAINNPNSSDIVLDSVESFEDKRLMILEENFPIVIAGNTTRNIAIAFVPKGNTESLFEKVKLYFNCYRFVFTNIMSNIIAPKLLSLGYDFGIVRVGDLKEGRAFIRNIGNVANILESLEFANNSPFALDTAGIFPFYLAPKDTLFIKAEFCPQSLGHFELDLKVNNEFEIDAPFKLTGRGASPSFLSKIIDWEKRRIGTLNDTTIYLKNEGDFPGELTFSEFIKFDSVFNTNNIAELSEIVAPNDSIQVHFSFNPKEVGYYNAAISLNLDWELHGDLSIDLLGIGTVPKISTFDVDFDTIIVWNVKDTVAKNIYSFGNELLSIDHIVPVEGDTSSFIIDYSKLKDLKIDSAFHYEMPISFFPKRVGEHSLKLEISHDAAANFERRLSYINLRGYALSSDTTDMEIILSTPQNLTACLESEIYFEVKNKGNTNLELQKLNISQTGIKYFEILAEPQIPSLIKPSSSVFLKAMVLLNRDSTGFVEIETQINDTIFNKYEFILLPEVEQIVINKIENIEKNFGDTLYLKLSGIFPTKSVLPININFDILLKNKNYFLLAEEADLEIDNITDKFTLKLNFSQNIEKIFVSCKDGIGNINEGAKWNFEIPLMVLLSEFEDFDIKILANLNDCYDANTLSISPLINDICIHTLRLIKLSESGLEASISPNPASEKLNLELNLNEDDYVNFYIYDKIGRKTEISAKKYLKKGLYYLIFEIGDMPNDVYIFSIQTEKHIKNIKFIISK